MGDFDILFDFNLLENYCIDKLKKRNYTILFIDGNHENFKKLNKYNTEEWNGGKVHKIKDNIIHLTRGQIFNIDGNTFFTMGGGISHKKELLKRKAK